MQPPAGGKQPAADRSGDFREKAKGCWPGGHKLDPAGAVSAMKPPVSVILIRENAEQLTGSGCCGKLDDDDPVLRGRDVFREAKKHQRDLGVLHRAIREFFPPRDDREQVAVVTVDPRNQLYLIAKLFADVIRYRPGWRAALRTVLQAFSLPAVVVNGRVISRRGRPPDPVTLRETISRLLAPGNDRA